ncbi:UDP-N-acetylmuramoyl-tripeptide--D-alanyl-D-alanine ligase [Acidiferrobacter sp.]|uniref:UDP-N-acetylmuramoyl-tripeptide--D-alanyl-D- alanine ligase n=1 Tax=Acidiferrobacter sp. TaxID=1872107 RepID=UPI0026292E38|nr:UDP-N-acetylmuramoyl-tripeptide--D-alanyl-D-alanine ligase [Acidiferrobacter sp.]
MMTIDEAAQAIGAGPAASGWIESVATDTRTMTPGCLFFALRGARFDGHAFLRDAAAQGAVAAVTDRPCEPGWPPCLVVPDTRLALGRLAAYWRRKMGARVLAVTGSNGKTSVKEMTARILAVEQSGIATRGNLNNDIGVPLTLLRLRPSHRYAVIEMGMNRHGEIAALAALAAPDVAVVTNAGHAHLAGLGTVEAVAREKGSLYPALGPGGIAIINADDPYAAYWRGLARGPVWTYGLSASADVSARFTLGGQGTELAIEARGWTAALPVRLAVLGRHNVANALAATALSLAVGASRDAIAVGLARTVPVAGRLEGVAGRAGSRVIDDSYNANPDSARAALAVLADLPGERWFVLGDMAELGEGGAALHRSFGEAASAAGIEHLWTLGTLSAEASRAFGGGARHYEDQETLLRDLQAALHKDAVVLIKGSRSMRMERLVSALRAS